ncbi:MAG: hypothetical protein ACKOW5_03275, partial [Actinomycetales bacterium]
GIDVEDGPTDEQLRVLAAIAAEVWDRPGIDLATVRRVGPEELADRLVDRDHREAFHELHLTLEACRHPQSAAQVEAVRRYADALEVDAEDLEMFRLLMSEGVEAAAQDYQRFLNVSLAERFEPSLADLPVDPDHPEMALAEKLGTFAEYGPHTLGRAYLRFYERSGFTLPGKDPSAITHFFVAHDMTHTIAGISTTVAGEVALSAFQFAMNNSRINRAALLASLVAHEAGFAHPKHLAVAETGTLANPKATLLLARELRRGTKCRADFSLVDHFELAPMPLAEVRQEFGVVVPDDPQDGHHWW